MTTPKRHHFVPRWYLESFAEPGSGFLHVYDRVKREFRRQRPGEVMTIGRYYRQEWVPQGIDPDIFEKWLGSELEPEAKEALGRLISAPKDITPEDTAAILVYLEAQRIRVPRQADSARAFLMSVALRVFPPKLAAALLMGKIAIDDSFRFDLMRRSIGQLHPFFSRMRWRIIEAEGGLSFITSDSPVSFFNVAFKPPNEAGPGLLGTAVIFPIDSKHLLIMQHPEYEPGGPRSPTERLPDPPPKDSGIPVIYGESWGEESVRRQNWVMYQLSQRVIVGNSQQVVRKAIRKPAQKATGTRPL